MLPNTSSILVPALRKLQLWQSLSDEDGRAFLAMPRQVRSIRAHQYIVREQEKPRECCVLLSGFAIRHKTTGNGDRQIFSIHMPGDFLDLHNALLRTADHSIEALNRASGAFIPIEEVKKLAFDRPSIGLAMWYDTLVDGAIFREWTLNVSRRDALTRTAHMFCEFTVRMQAAGLGDGSAFELPMTQRELADALGLTAIHLNRQLKILQSEGLISMTKRAVSIIDYPQLVKLGDFDPRYLHIGRSHALDK